MIEKANMKDLETIMEIYAYARESMKANGNPNQWKDDRPSKESIIDDILKENLYVVLDNGIITGVFALVIGDDPTYKYIEGKWSNEVKYGTIHRIASNGKSKGIFRKCLDYCFTKVEHIRIDTHEDNKIMQKLIEDAGFKKCGTIYVDDGSPRIAYQKSNIKYIQNMVHMAILLFMFVNLFDYKIILIVLASTFLIVLGGANYYRYDDRLKLSIRAMSDIFSAELLGLCLSYMLLLVLSRDMLKFNWEASILVSILTPIMLYWYGLRNFVNDKNKKIKFSILIGLVSSILFTVVSFKIFS